MNVETNENKKINNLKETNENNIDMQATQRIVFLGDFVSQNDIEVQKRLAEESKAEELVDEKVVEINDESVTAQSDAEIKDETINEENDVEIINNNSNSEISTDSEAQPDEISNSEVSIQNVQTTPEQNSEDEINKIKKEKQHAQDKKDYRLERMLFDRINTMQGKIKESLELIKKFERINAKEENLPNIVTTLHDKLTHEVIKQFRTVGIEFNMKSFLVQSVVSDLLGKFEEGITEFKDCSENLNFVREVQEDFESRVELAPTSKVKNLFAKIRGIFKPERKQEKLEELERERQEKKLQEANIHLIKYKFINSELERYTIKNNIVNSLSKEMLHGQCSGLSLSVNEFIDKRIVSEMKKLGLEGSVEELKDTLYCEYKEKDDTINKEDFGQIQMGVLKKNMKLQKLDVVRSKISATVNINNADEKEEEMVI